MAVFAGYRRLDAANGSNNGLSQAGMACALIAAISGPIPIVFPFCRPRSAHRALGAKMQKQPFLKHTAGLNE